MRYAQRSSAAIAAVVAGLVLFVAPAGRAQQAASAEAPADAARGKKFFMDYGCYRCHGTEAQGGSSGARLVPRIVPLIGLIAYVRQPTGQMPPYTSAVVSDSELADIDAYLRQIPPAPPVASLPLLNQ